MATTGFLKKNIDYVKRNGDAPAGKTIIKYVNVQARDGISGTDAFTVQLSPNNMTFKAGSYNAVPNTYYVNVYVTRGTTRINALVLDSSITGVEQNVLTASTVAGTNGTLNTRIAITTYANLTADDGQLIIPVQYNLDAYDGSTAYNENDWDPEQNSLETFDAIFSWTLGKTGQSMFNLDLSNETATINCSSTGHVLNGAVRPPCKATLSFGADSSLSGVYYDASFSPVAQGIGINHQTGVILYDHDVHAYDSTIPDASFDFGDASTNTILNITIDASYQGKKQGYKVMKIEKALPGQQGPAGETPYIGANGNWWIGGTDTGVKAEGENGDTPYIGANGNWWIGNTDTGTKASGDTPYIGPNGNWYIGTTDTGIKAEGENGDTPYIGANGNWWIGNTDTGIRAEGQDAVSRWLELSANQVKIDSSNNIIPNKIYAYAWKQVGEQTPEKDASLKIKWANDSSVTSTLYTTSGVSVQSTWNYMTFKLYDTDGSTYLGESETVPILKDGKNGAEGPQGRRGAAIRGPVLWDSSSNVNKTGLDTRWFYCGTMSSTPPNILEEQFIDVIMHDKKYYVCNRNYEQPSGATWTQTMSDGYTVASHWTVADASYNFVAANVILAKNAGIDFLTGNEIYLRDSDGNITAGASGGTGISFWAGGEKDENPPFQVDSSGNITATSGTFAGYVQYPYTNILTLNKTTPIGDSSVFVADNRANIVSIPDENYDSSIRYLKLPTPDASHNGFTYTILIQPTTNTRGSGGSYEPAGVKLYAADNSDIWCYAYPQLMRCDKWYFECGYLVLTCIPTADGYEWAITQATGIMEYYSSSHEYSSGTHKDYYYTYHVSPVLGTSRDRDVSTGGAINPSLKTTVDMIYNIWTYKDGDTPGLNNTSVMYVKE